MIYHCLVPVSDPYTEFGVFQLLKVRNSCIENTMFGMILDRNNAEHSDQNVPLRCCLIILLLLLHFAHLSSSQQQCGSSQTVHSKQKPLSDHWPLQRLQVRPHIATPFLLFVDAVVRSSWCQRHRDFTTDCVFVSQGGHRQNKRALLSNLEEAGGQLPKIQVQNNLILIKRFFLTFRVRKTE